MTNILIAGAGKSSYYLIHYLLKHGLKNKWTVTVMDGSKEAIEDRIEGHPLAKVAVVDITQDAERRRWVAQADLVVSLMPPQLHILLATDCIDYKKPLITASYVSPEMRALHQAAQERNLMFMCEMGLDPGIDHMTAAAIFQSIHKVSGTIKSFKSYCGGLVAPESDNNLWHYKFSWNPRNVVSAGLGGATYLYQGKEIHVPYEQLFNPNQTLQVPGNELLSWYANRDSRPYAATYDLQECPTLIRATLRHPDFSLGWNALIQLGLTSIEQQIDDSITTYLQWTAHALGSHSQEAKQVKECIGKKLSGAQVDKVLLLLEDLGLFDPTPISNHTSRTYADILLSLLIKKWSMKPEDKDRVVMQHDVVYTVRKKDYSLSSSMTLIGENQEKTAMAKTVGLPMAILARLYLQKKIAAPSGVVIPVMKSIYSPVLKALEHEGIIFNEETH